jgi:hypothetical protein
MDRFDPFGDCPHLGHFDPIGDWFIWIVLADWGLSPIGRF